MKLPLGAASRTCARAGQRVGDQVALSGQEEGDGRG